MNKKKRNGELSNKCERLPLTLNESGSMLAMKEDRGAMLAIFVGLSLRSSIVYQLAAIMPKVDNGRK